MNLTDILGGHAKDNTNQVKAEAIPEASPILEVRPSRPPDSWLEDGSGNKIPTWNTDADIKPKWKSKIFITQVVMFAMAVMTMVFGVDLSPEIQKTVVNAVLAIIGGGNIMTVVFRFFFSSKKLV